MPGSNSPPTPHSNPVSTNWSTSSQLGPTTRSQIRARGVAAQGPSPRSGGPEVEPSSEIRSIADTPTTPSDRPLVSSSTTGLVLGGGVEYDEEEDSRSHGGSHDGDTSDVSDGGLSNYSLNLSREMERRKAPDSDWDTEDEHMEEMYPSDNVEPEIDDT